MRLLLLIALLLGQVVLVPGRCQEYTISVQGVTGTGSGIYASVPPTPFTATFYFNMATAVPTLNAFPLGPTAGAYVDPTGSGVYQAGTLSYPGTTPVIQVFSGTVGSPGLPGSVNYGYAITDTSPNGYAFELLLLGSDSDIAPTIGLDSIHTVPLNEFGPQGTIFNGVAVAAPSEEGDLFGSVTSFNVDVVAAPEPSSFGLAVLGAGFLILRLAKLKARRPVVH